MLGSSDSIACANIMLNTAVAESLRLFADELETAEDFNTSLHNLIKRTIKAHKRILFNGNGYDDAWIAEAEKRGLLNLMTTPDCLPYYVHEKNLKLFATHKIYTETEVRSRCEIMLANYSKIVNIEGLTMVDMVKKDILPAVSSYLKILAETGLAKKAFCSGIDCSYEETLVQKLSALCGNAFAQVADLENKLQNALDVPAGEPLAVYYKDVVLSAMFALRATVDEMETMTDAKYWPYPSYGELLFGVN